jgi:hypothetical protein
VFFLFLIGRNSEDALQEDIVRGFPMIKPRSADGFEGQFHPIITPPIIEREPFVQ